MLADIKGAHLIHTQFLQFFFGKICGKVIAEKLDSPIREVPARPRRPPIASRIIPVNGADSRGIQADQVVDVIFTPVRICLIRDEVLRPGRWPEFFKVIIQNLFLIEVADGEAGHQGVDFFLGKNARPRLASIGRHRGPDFHSGILDLLVEVRIILINPDDVIDMKRLGGVYGIFGVGIILGPRSQAAHQHITQGDLSNRDISGSLFAWFGGWLRG